MKLIIAGIAILLWGAAAQADEGQKNDKEKDTDAQSKEIELVVSPERPCAGPSDCDGPILVQVPEKDAPEPAEPMPVLFASLMVTSPYRKREPTRQIR